MWLRLLLLTVFLSSSLRGKDLDLPRLTDPVMDQAGVLDGATQERLIRRLTHLDHPTAQLVVLTLASLQGVTIEEFGVAVARKWQIGSREQNDGVILLVAPNERKVRIEVGYGLEGLITDAISHRIIQDIILPRFRQGDIPQGVEQGAKTLADLIEGNITVQPKKPDKHWSPLFIFLCLLLGFIFLQALLGDRVPRNSSLGTRGYRGHWGGGPFGGGWGGGSGGGFSGGGGSFGGGGSSGSW